MTTYNNFTIILSSALIAISLLLTGCVIHKVEVQQGNVIPAQVVNHVKPGMSKQQVISLLGTPLLHDSFQRDRWDYHFSFKDKKGAKQQRNLTLFFQGDTLARVSH